MKNLGTGHVETQLGWLSPLCGQGDGFGHSYLTQSGGESFPSEEDFCLLRKRGVGPRKMSCPPHTELHERQRKISPGPHPQGSYSLVTNDLYAMIICFQRTVAVCFFFSKGVECIDLKGFQAGI